MSDVLDRLKAALADRYTVERELGSGGMAVVYLAEDLRHERRVAIKILRPELTSVVASERFLREIKLTAALAHPHILPLLDSGEAGGLLYYVMPYAEGESLRERLTREKQLPIDEAVRIAREVADALSYAHAQEVLHRDIKPENILLEAGHAVVADFGIARALSEAAGDRLTDTGVSIGTPAYMSPEQAAGEREITEGSDLYSLACVLYEMLTGEPPITDASVQKVVSRKLLGDFRPAREVRSKVPADVDAAVSKALATAPAERLATASEFADALEPVRPEDGTRLRRRGLPWAAVAAVVVVAGLVWYAGWGRSPGRDRRSIAVLPLENLSREEATEPFTDGIHDDILTHLYRIGDLKVISRTSVLEYRNTTKNLREIADELGVATILEGGVQRAGNRVRINVQLIDAKTDEHIWAETYEEDLTAQNVFAIQTDIAKQIAAALKAALTVEELERIKDKPTDNLEAYDFYLRGVDLFYGSELEQDRRMAADLFAKAVELDPGFARAYAKLSEAHSVIYFYRYDYSEVRLAMARESVERARELGSHLAEVQSALAYYYYWGLEDYDKALTHFEAALKIEPNNADVLAGIAYVQRRQGRFEEAVHNLKEAARLDPRSATIASNIGETYWLMREFEKAVAYLGRAISLNPSWPFPYRMKAEVYMASAGDTAAAREILDGVLGNVDPQEISGGSLITSLRIDLFRRDFDRAWARLVSCPEEALSNQFLYWPKSLVFAAIRRFSGAEAGAIAYFDTARAHLEARLRVQPADERYHSALGIAYAGLGLKEQALREGSLGVELMPVSKDAYKGVYRIEALAKIMVMVGQYEEALGKLEYLLSIPGTVSAYIVRLDPTWDPLRDHPRFQALLDKYE